MLLKKAFRAFSLHEALVRLDHSLFDEPETGSEPLDYQPEVFSEAQVYFRNQNPNWTDEEVSNAAKSYAIDAQHKTKALLDNYHQTGDRGRRL